MAVCKILKYPDPFLETRSAPVDITQTSLIQEIASDLFDTLTISKKGIGLAAPQIGHGFRVIAIKPYPHKQIVIMVNPEITDLHQETMLSNEGCLSVPNVYEQVVRSKKITVKYIDIHSNEVESEFTGIDAVCIQHEIDHLNGILFITKVEAKRLRKAMKKYNPGK